MLTKRTTVYAGFDPTASSLHVGNLATLVALLHFYLGGHDVIVLVGGATGCIGDPSGRSTERSAMDQTVVDANAGRIQRQISQLLDSAFAYAVRRTDVSNELKERIAKREGLRMVNNVDWIGGMSLVSFMRDVGKHVRVSSMLGRDSVKSRLASRASVPSEGISFTEFSYQILQAYDFWHLFSTYGCRIQLGGSDQWGNMIAGTELVHKYLLEGRVPSHPSTAPLSAKYNNNDMQKTNTENDVYCITIPLIKNDTGAKIGKSAGNAVWLDSSLLPPFDLYQV